MNEVSQREVLRAVVAELIGQANLMQNTDKKPNISPVDPVTHLRDIADTIRSMLDGEVPVAISTLYKKHQGLLELERDPDYRLYQELKQRFSNV